MGQREASHPRMQAECHRRERPFAGRHAIPRRRNVGSEQSRAERRHIAARDHGIRRESFPVGQLDTRDASTLGQDPGHMGRGADPRTAPFGEIGHGAGELA